MKKSLLFIIVFFVFIVNANSYNEDLVVFDGTKTIKELKENIIELNKDKIDLNKDLKILNADEKLIGFFKKDLTKNDISIIKGLIENFDVNNAILNKQLINAAKDLSGVDVNKKKLLLLKKELYIKLSPFISNEAKNDYLEYILGDTKILKEKKDITTDIIIKKEIISKKVSNIEGKIIEHKKQLEDNLKKIIEKRFIVIINKIKNNPKFINLSNDLKISVLNKTIIKIESKIKKIENNIFISENDNKKINTYNIAIQKIKDLKNTYR